MVDSNALGDVVAALDALYDPVWAESWDAVGLVCGDPRAPVRRVLLAVDPVSEVVDEALEWGADLIVTHHPLLLRPVHGVPATDPKGRVVHRLISAGVGLYVAHTNADVACPGVSDALAALVGLAGTRPLAPADADPAGRRGLGRVGELDRPVTLRELAARAAGILPASAGGLRVAGDPEQIVCTVAVCGGAGDGLLEAARVAGADAYLTADLRHHPASEARSHGPMALLDAAHWASEWPWLADAARRLAGAAPSTNTTVETHVSKIVTDPWTYCVARGTETPL